MNRKLQQEDPEFHAGKFLLKEMIGMNHDVEWLSAHSGYDVEFLLQLFQQSNMDALLFVKIGNAIGPAFFKDLNRLMFPDGYTPPS